MNLKDIVIIVLLGLLVLTQAHRPPAKHGFDPDAYIAAEKARAARPYQDDPQPGKLELMTQGGCCGG